MYDKYEESWGYCGRFGRAGGQNFALGTDLRVQAASQVMF